MMTGSRMDVCVRVLACCSWRRRKAIACGRTADSADG